jgi:haloacetate dehalogenase
MPGLRSTTMGVAGRTVALDAGGAGPPVLLLHGFPQTRHTWRRVAPQLTDRFSVICPDLPGYGDSERLGDGPEGFAKSRIAAHVIEMMRELGHERFAVIGHDRGRWSPSERRWTTPRT